MRTGGARGDLFAWARLFTNGLVLVGVFAGALELHDSSETFGDLDLRGGAFDAAARHPRADHHVEASRPAYREPCAACLAASHRAAPAPSTALPAERPQGSAAPASPAVAYVPRPLVAVPAGRAPPFA